MITVERDDAVTTIWLDRPDRRNALTPGMLAELVEAAHAAADAGSAVLLAGRGPCFCAGFDLAMCQGTPDGTVMRLLLTGLSDACQALRQLPRPVVIAAHGAAIAGGCALLGAGDIIVADRGAKLGYPVVKLGVSPAVSVPFLRQGVTDGEARRRTLMPETFTGEEAHRRALVHELVDGSSDVYDRARALAHELAAKPAEAYAATKRWLNTLEGITKRRDAERALEVSLGLTGGDEECSRIGALKFGTQTENKR